MANDEVQSPDNLARRRFLTATTAVVGAVGVGAGSLRRNDGPERRGA